MKKKLSFIIPAWNESATIEQLLIKVLNLTLPDSYAKEIIVIDDGSKDNTVEIVSKLAKKYPEISLLINEKNLGKTQTVKKGILASTGEYVVIQDADLEYDPYDVVMMFQGVLHKDLDVAYGDRFGGHNGMGLPGFYIGNLGVSFVSNLFTFPRLLKWIPDMEVCYKLVRGNIMREIGATISTKSRFGLEPEITAKLVRYKKGGKLLRWGIFPISYFPRSIAEGKKIRYSDGFKAIIEIIKFNLFN